MNGISIFILGLLAGWLIEWIIDWFYWRRKRAVCLEENARLKARLQELENEQTASRSYDASVEATEIAPDDLTLIHGIGPVIADKLERAGVITFEALAALSSEQLKEILGDLVERLADEEDLLQQAKNFAKEKRRARQAGGSKKKEKKKKGKKAGKKKDTNNQSKDQEQATT